MQALAELRAAVDGRREFFYEVLSRKAGIEAKRAAFRAVERRGRRLTDAGLAGLRRAEELGVADEIRDAKKQFYRGRIERAAGLREEVLERGGVGYGFLDEMHRHRETASEPRNPLRRRRAFGATRHRQPRRHHSRGVATVHGDGDPRRRLPREPCSSC